MRTKIANTVQSEKKMIVGATFEIQMLCSIFLTHFAGIDVISYAVHGGLLRQPLGYEVLAQQAHRSYSNDGHNSFQTLPTKVRFQIWQEFLKQVITSPELMLAAVMEVFSKAACVKHFGTRRLEYFYF